MIKTYPVNGKVYISIATIDPKTHAVDDSGEPLCGRVQAKNILVTEDFETASKPTCPVCARRDPRFKPKPVKPVDDFDPVAKEPKYGLGYMQGRGAA